MSAAPIATDLLGEILQQGIRQEADRIVREEGDAAAERVRQRVADLVDSIALRAFSAYRIDLRAGELIIRVDRTALDPR